MSCIVFERPRLRYEEQVKLGSLHVRYHWTIALFRPTLSRRVESPGQNQVRCFPLGLVDLSQVLQRRAEQQGED
jgi:hypothetical protein